MIFSFSLFLVFALFGCSGVPVERPALSIARVNADNINPLFVQTDDSFWLWESTVDVLDNYFPIANENPIQSRTIRDEKGVVSVARTEGRIDTKPVIAAGVLQPWKKNSVDISQRIEATFQTIRRSAVVRIVPEGNGFLVHLAVYNELENLPEPMNSNISNRNNTFSNDISQIELPTGTAAPSEGWIPLGRNTELEQYILEELAWRLNNPPVIVNPKENKTVPAGP
ncbi:MAG: hypothetical protein Q4G69_12975 [Planctomycetia bacterium]|nr:hypothetical protein [Planctomycetia bacterium]